MRAEILIGRERRRRWSANDKLPIVREIMVSLHSHGVGTARAVRIFKTYGTDAVQGNRPLRAAFC